MSHPQNGWWSLLACTICMMHVSRCVQCAMVAMGMPQHGLCHSQHHCTPCLSLCSKSEGWPTPCKASRPLTACSCLHGCMYAFRMSIFTPFLQPCMLMALCGWCNHLPRCPSPSLGPSPKPQHAFGCKQHYLVSLECGHGSITLAVVQLKFLPSFHHDCTTS